MRWESRSVPAPKLDLLPDPQRQQVLALRQRWVGQRINWPDWQANAVQQKAAYDTMRERRAA